MKPFEPVDFCRICIPDRTSLGRYFTCEQCPTIMHMGHQLDVESGFLSALALSVHDAGKHIALAISLQGEYCETLERIVFAKVQNAKVYQKLQSKKQLESWQKLGNWSSRQSDFVMDTHPPHRLRS